MTYSCAIWSRGATTLEEAQRTKLDLVCTKLALQPGERILDVGCGEGTLTRQIAARGAIVVGVDSSPDMVAAAQARGLDARAIDAEALPFVREFDAVFSNAALHWLDDHATLFPRLLGLVAPGGVLAVQMPRNFGEPSHTSITETAREERWRARLAPLIRPEPCKPPVFYWDLLAPRVTSLDVWETVYQQRLTGDNPVADFVKGSWLRPYLDALDGDERAAFEAAYRARVARAYPARPDGTTLFPFRRQFIVAQC